MRSRFERLHTDAPDAEAHIESVEMPLLHVAGLLRIELHFAISAVKFAIIAKFDVNIEWASDVLELLQGIYLVCQVKQKCAR